MQAENPKRIETARKKIDVYEFKIDEAKSSRALTFELQSIEQKKRFLSILKVFHYTLSEMIKENDISEIKPIKANLRLENGDVSLKLYWDGIEECKTYHQLVLCAIGELALEITEPSKEIENEDAETPLKIDNQDAEISTKIDNQDAESTTQVE